MVAVWSAHVAADASGVPWDRCEAGDPGETARAMSAISSSSVSTALARVCTTAAAVLSPATAVCWA